MSSCGETNFSSIHLNYLHKIYFEKSWAWWLNHIGTFVVFLIGVCGNMLCLVVLCRRPFRLNSYTQYLIALAIVDTGAIFSEVIAALDELYQYHQIDKRTFIQHTGISCKFYYYIRFIFYSMSSWIVVALALERLVAIKYPLWSKYICSVTNARRIILFILVFTLVIQSYHLVVKGLDCNTSYLSSTQNCRCKTLPGYASLDIFFTIYIWRLVLMTLMPLIIIITVNILIMSKLFNKNTLIDHTNTADNARRKLMLRYRVSRMLVIVSSVYLLLHVPGSSLEIFKSFLVHIFRICDLKWQYYIHIAQNIFDLLTNFNYGINFYLYIVSSKHIRRELVRRHSSTQSSPIQNRKKCPKSKHLLSSYIYLRKQTPSCNLNVTLSQCESISTV